LDTISEPLHEFVSYS